MKFDITWQTNYNGVSCTLADEDEAGYMTRDLQAVMDLVSDTLPDLTYDMPENPWDLELSEEQVQILFDTAKKILDPFVENPEFEFHYDYTST